MGSANDKPASYYIDGILKGDVVSLSRAITLVESSQPAHQEIARQVIDAVISRSGNSFRVGITGVPGVGKSTFIESFGKEVVGQGHKLAVLAIDPSSTKSKGSILGDKTRMESLSSLPGVYIRPSPTTGTLGGVTRVTYETILLCEAAGFNYIVVETVGVGQSEVEVGKITDFFLLLMLAGAGDELQGIKRGIMEMADALVITKADGDNLDKAKAARSEYAHALHLMAAADSGWIPKTMICSAIENTGIKEVFEMIEAYRKHTVTTGYFTEKRKEQQYTLLLHAIDEQLLAKFYGDEAIRKRLAEIRNSEVIQPFSLASELVARLKLKA